MFSLRSILFAAAAFVTLTSAIPAPQVPSIPAVGGAGGLPAVPNLGDLSLPGLPAKRGAQSFGDHIGDCHDKIEIIILEIGKAVHCEGGPDKIDHEIVIGLLGDIVIALKDLLVELKVFVKIDLLLHGVICTVKDLAEIIAGLVIIVLEVVYLVLSIVGFLDVKLCGVIGVIGGLLCEILTLVIGLLFELKVEIAVLLKGYSYHCGYAHWDNLLVLLGLVLKV